MPFTPDVGMRFSTVLSALGLILALMQGALSLESTAPARISLLKAHLMFFLEFLEVIVVFASEIIAFVMLRRALSKRLQWLDWLAPAILTLGISELVIDAFLTLRAVTFSRALWVPLSSLSGAGGWTEKVEFLFLCITCLLSFFLVGWRQAWFWRRDYFVTPSTAVSAAQAEPTLQFSPFAMTIGFALFILVIPAIFALLSTILALFGKGADGAWKALWVLRRPTAWYREPQGSSDDRDRLSRQYKLLAYIMKPGEVVLENVDEMLREAPLHIGNTLIGADCRTVSKREIVRKVGWQHRVIMIGKQLAIMPFMLATILALHRLHLRMDKQTYEVFEELADAASVIVLQELGAGLKSLIWKLLGRSKNVADDSEIELLVHRDD